MNTYLSKIKTEIEKFYNVAKTYDDEVAAANEKYKPDIAQQEINRLNVDLMDDKADAIDTIKTIVAKAVQSVTTWGTLDGRKIDDNDIKLLEYKLTQEQFDNLVNKHKNNGTMCFVLNQYAEKMNKKAKNETEVLNGYLDTSAIPTVETKINAYSLFGETAIDIINSMLDVGIGKGVSSPILEESINSFGLPNQINYNLLKAIEE